MGYFSLVDFPDKAAKGSWRFLSERECNFILRRVEKDRGDSRLEAFTLGRFLRPALDLKIWGFALIFLWVTSHNVRIVVLTDIQLFDDC